MTQDEIACVQASFRAVVPIKDQAAALFYARLFEIDPSTKPMFANTDLHAQGGMLMAAIGFVVGSLRQPDAMLATVRALAVRHVGYGVADRHYDSVGQALIWTLERGLGEAWTPQLAGAWTAAYTMLSQVMIAASHEAATTLPPASVVA